MPWIALSPLFTHMQVFFRRSSPKTDRSSDIEPGDDRAIIDPVAVVTGVAMITIDVRSNIKQVESRFATLATDVRQRAAVRALNATIQQSKSRMARQISREFMITAATARDRLKISRAQFSGGIGKLEATLAASQRSRGRGMNLIAFVERKVSLAELRRRRRRGDGMARQLRFQIRRTGGKKIIPGAFIQNAGRTVFIRSGKNRYPIRALSTIDVPQMFNTRRINSAVREYMMDRFSINYARELRAIMRGFAK